MPHSRGHRKCGLEAGESCCANWLGQRLRWGTTRDLVLVCMTAQVLSRVVPGADVFALCLLGDAFVVAECGKVYQKKDKSKRKVEKGG